jgi:hypothetical protein
MESPRSSTDEEDNGRQQSQDAFLKEDCEMVSAIVSPHGDLHWQQTCEVEPATAFISSDSRPKLVIATHCCVHQIHYSKD